MICPKCQNTITIDEFGCSRCGLKLPVNSREERIRAEAIAKQLYAGKRETAIEAEKAEDVASEAEEAVDAVVEAEKAVDAVDEAVETEKSHEKTREATRKMKATAARVVSLSAGKVADISRKIAAWDAGETSEPFVRQPVAGYFGLQSDPVHVRQQFEAAFAQQAEMYEDIGDEPVFRIPRRMMVFAATATVIAALGITVPALLEASEPAAHSHDVAYESVADDVKDDEDGAELFSPGFAKAYALDEKTGVKAEPRDYPTEETLPAMVNISEPAEEEAAEEYIDLEDF